MDFDCDFNAPMYCDFEDIGTREHLDLDDEKADSYFDVDHENKDEKEEEEEAKKDQDEPPPALPPKCPTPAARSTKLLKVPPPPPPAVPSFPTLKSRRPPNIVTSWPDDLKKKKTFSSGIPDVLPDVLPERENRRKAAVSKTLENVWNSPKLVLTRRTPKKLSTNSAQPRLSVPQKGGTSRRSSIGGSRPSRIPSASQQQEQPQPLRPSSEKKKKNENKPVRGNTPTKRFKNFLGVQNRISLKRKSSNSKQEQRIPVRPVTTTTTTKSSSGGGGGGNPVKAPPSGMVDFTKMLRSYETKIEKPLMTKAGKFEEIRTSRERNRSAAADQPIMRSVSIDRPTASKTVSSKFVSMAEAIMNLQHGTPDRFRTLPRGRSASPRSRRSRRGRSASPAAAAEPRTTSSSRDHLTVPKSPKLMTTARSRPPAVLSAKELMEKEIEEMKKYQFKARAINEGVKPTKWGEVEQRHTTVPQPFHLHEPAPKVTVEKTNEAAKEAALFKANPVPKKIFSAPVGIPEKKVIPPVVPESPTFNTQERAASKTNKHTSSESLDSQSSKASGKSSRSSSNDRGAINKAPPHHHHSGGVQQASSKAKKTTEIQPFSFDERLATIEQKKKEKIKEILEQERKEREFKAKPVPPNLEKAVNLPMKEVLLPTKPVPFNLEIEKRVESRTKKWEEEVENELRKQREAANFKAKPVKHFEPFVPHPSDKPLSEISNFELHSERRAIEREAFEMYKKAKEAELEGQKRELEERRRKEEEEEIRRLRQEAVHKANPIRNYPPIIIQPSNKPVTEPISPDFYTMKRCNSKQQQHSNHHPAAN